MHTKIRGAFGYPCIVGSRVRVYSYGFTNVISSFRTRHVIHDSNWFSWEVNILAWPHFQRHNDDLHPWSFSLNWSTMWIFMKGARPIQSTLESDMLIAPYGPYMHLIRFAFIQKFKPMNINWLLHVTLIVGRWTSSNKYGLVINSNLWPSMGARICERRYSQSPLG